MTEKKVNLNRNQVIALLNNERKKVEDLNVQVNQSRQHLNEIIGASETLKHLKNVKANEEAMMSIGAGTFINCTLKDNLKVKQLYPGDIVIEITLDKAVTDLDKRKESIEKQIKMLREQLDKTYQNYSNMEQVLKLGDNKTREEAK
ncbi:MAG: prefoldin subunit alpha [archaeon]